MIQLQSLFKGLFNLTLVRTYLIIQLITRIILTVYGLLNNQVQLIELPTILFIGLINDLIPICYFLPPILVLSVLFYKLSTRSRYLFSIATHFFAITILLLNAIAEMIFWDEFGTRFNFIAVDYLIYTHEIIGTVRESLPLPLIICSLLAVTVIIVFTTRHYISQQSINFQISKHLIYSGSLLFLGIIAFNFYDSLRFSLSTNRYAIELARNGYYELFSAFRNNSLDYNKFYTTIDDNIALNVVRARIGQDSQEFLNNNNIDRYSNSVGYKPISVFKSHNLAKQQKYNVILITVESLSAEFMTAFGNKNNITPYLDELAKAGLFFTKIYATGTRTVRGLEAITLSIPPTPGSSIIRRPNNQHLFNISSIFKEQGYVIDFVFGGYSYFDNLENYFTGNNYKITDRSNLKAEEISFSNIWGVADEDILSKALAVADQNYTLNQPFFSLILTTSNHRPYTFPAGRIDLPSGGGRNAAVKYTDYAIGKFIEAARTHPWFANTIFVIVADHCAASAGKTDLPVEKYHIPLIIYAPEILQPTVIDHLASQIDIAPTMLGLALPGYSYKTKFFGQDILQAPPNRAFISTYQLLGFMKDDNLVILAPNSLPNTYQLIANEKHKIEDLPALVQEAISFYQLAYKLYINGEMQEFEE
ncbi:Alkaline phosphatase/LTA synthase family protein [Candidatus Trichorickettsia mobilis]|uniref:Alkaline phosphatase/LTA synthase family protein n=1 Tax=Candidatus Trichorickettsia mobilis TaxID=1346319 RepID=A0ABZ0UWP9_9RICK|nr:LTA synthase family protein [Candidatus Trichorickettsia mobilis]WPY01344.1 Alkaline phosphatase/LTA synthase family protein [Candidatus Trichorickettsia mobilis]